MSTAHLQISHADVIIVNKADTLASGEELDAVIEKIRGINGLARVVVTEYSRVPELERYLLDLKAYDGVEDLEKVEEGTDKGHGHLDPVSLSGLIPSFLKHNDFRIVPTAPIKNLLSRELL